MFQYRLPARKAFQLNAQSARYMRTLSNSDNPDLRKLLGHAQVHTETEQFLIADRQTCQYSPLVTPRSPQPPPPSPTDPTVATVSTELLPQIPEGLTEIQLPNPGLPQTRMRILHHLKCWKIPQEV